MLSQRRRPPCLLIAGALAVTSACNDHRAPTAPPVAANAAVVAAAGSGNSTKVKVKTLQLSSNTLRIDGPGVTAMVSIGNPGLAIETEVSIRAEIVQGAATRQAANVLTQCQPGDDPGFLPNGNCDMSVAATASNAAAGSGTLVPGAWRAALSFRFAGRPRTGTTGRQLCAERGGEKESGHPAGLRTSPLDADSWLAGGCRIEPIGP